MLKILSQIASENVPPNSNPVLKIVNLMTKNVFQTMSGDCHHLPKRIQTYCLNVTYSLRHDFINIFMKSILLTPSP